MAGRLATTWQGTMEVPTDSTTAWGAGAKLG